MKKLLFAGLCSVMACMCQSTQAQSSDTDLPPSYVVTDLSSGQVITVYYDQTSWRTLNKADNQPIEFYYVKNNGTNTWDTIHGATGIVVNGMVWKNEEGKWKLNDAKAKWDGKEFKTKDKYGRKIKWEKGELKFKDWNSKFKSESGDDTKHKEEWNKVKWNDDEMKTEEGSKKTKTKSDS